MASALIIDDSDAFRASARSLLEADGFEVAERLARLETPPAVVLTSSRDGRDYGSLIAGSPARGFIAKNELSAAAIHALLAGQR